MHLEDLQNPRFVQPLIERLADPVAAVRKYAARALGKQGDLRGVPVLTGLLQDELEEAGVRKYAAGALGDLGDDGGLRELTKALRQRSYPEDVRCGAVDGLIRSQNAKYFPELTAVVDDASEAPLLRSFVLWNIRQFRDGRVGPWLQATATNPERNNDVRCQAAVELVQLRDGAVAGVEIVEAIVNGNYNIERSIHAISANGEIKRNAYRALAARGASKEIRDAAQAQIDEYERRRK
jgi:HEAT repeat protein